VGLGSWRIGFVGKLGFVVGCSRVVLIISSSDFNYKYSTSI